MASAEKSHVGSPAAKLTEKNGVLYDPGRRLPRVRDRGVYEHLSATVAETL